MTGNKRTYRPRLFGPWVYKKYPWYEDVQEAKIRKQELENKFDTWTKSSLSAEGKEQLAEINQELEIIDDYFDWLQITT